MSVELTTSPQHAGGIEDLVQLDKDHPGFRDAAYRSRRNAIARVALEYSGGPVPEVEYSEEEQTVWRTVWDKLGPLHEQLACRRYLEVSRNLNMPRTRIPQLHELNPILQAATGFRMLPVAGLVSARTFLSYLGDRIFLSTQYIRHHSAPLYTPEPDVVHELVGHAATFLDPDIAQLSECMGLAARRADDRGVELISQLYWHTLEFGVLEEDGDLKGYGAGVLSSAGEIQRFRGFTKLLPWDPDRMARTVYDPTDYQPHYFVAPSFQQMLADLKTWLSF